MRGTGRLWRAVSVLVFAWPLLAFTQQNPSPPGTAAPGESQPKQNAPVLATRPAPAPAPDAAEGRIKLDIVVSDKSGKPISGLDPKDFTLLDNNQPRRILSWRAFDGTGAKEDPPVEVILLVDTVNLGYQSVSFVRQQVESFLRQNGGHLALPVSLFVLTDAGLDVQNQPSIDGNALAAALRHLDDRLRTISRSAGAWGAIERVQLSVRTLISLAQNEAAKPGRKLLIWAGLGWPMLDSLNIQLSPSGQRAYFESIVELSTRLREARMSVYSVSQGQSGAETFLYEEFLKGVKTYEKATPPDVSLRVLAIQSGGRVLGPDNDLTAQIDNCVRDGTAFYALSFDPPRADRADEYHDLKVKIDRPGLVAHTNTGYYNQP